MSRRIRIGVTAVVSAVVFVGTWQGLERGLHVNQGLALAFAGAALAIVGGALGTWSAAAKPPHPLPEIRRGVWAMEEPDRDDIARPDLAKRVVDQVRRTRGGVVGLTTALVGAGGFGKTTLARQVCADPRIRPRYVAGAWITLGQQPQGSELAGRINDVYEALTGHRPQFVDPELAGQHLGELLDRPPRVLLVIDDVWSWSQLRPFLHKGKQCTRLVTTRRPRAVSRAVRADSVRVDRLDAAESRSLLTAGISRISENPMAELLRLTGGWPLLLRLTNGHLLESIGAGLLPDVAAADLVRLLTTGGPAVLRVNDEASRQQAADVSINASLDLLGPTKTDPFDGRPLFVQLGVFAEDSDIDLELVHALWRSTGGLESPQIDSLLERCDGLSLIADYRHGQAIRLHDVIRAYLREQIKNDLPRFNAVLVDAAATLLAGDGRATAPRWWLLPHNADYLWRNVCRHLAEANRAGKLDTLLQDLRWAESRIGRDGTAALDSDLALSVDPSTAILRRAIAQNAHLFARDAGHGQDEPRWLANVLVDRLLGTPGIQPLVEAYLATLPSDLQDRPRPAPDDPAHPALRRVLTGHRGAVYAVVVAPDGTWLATASHDGTARIWDATTGQARHILKGHTGPVRSCAIAPDGRWLATVSRDGTARIWEAATGRERHILRGHGGAVLSCAISPDGSWLVSTSDDGTARTWTATTGLARLVHTGHLGAVVSCAIAPDGQWFATTGVDATARIWDADGRLRHALSGHTNRVVACAVSPDGAWLATASFDRTARLWDTASGKLRHVLVGHTGPVVACAVGPDGGWLATTSLDQTARIWDARTGQVSRVLYGHPNPVLACAIDSDGTWIATASDDSTARTWDARTGRPHTILSGHKSSVLACALAPDGSWLVTASDDDTARTWDSPAVGARQQSVADPHRQDRAQA